MTLKIRERPELFNVWLDMTPMSRLGKPFEVSAAVVYLASRWEVALDLARAARVDCRQRGYQSRRCGCWPVPPLHTH
jgi:NAD(P)-dependent dehydrogenase (short-subunit alcohol dehydrogenase family)